MTPRVSDREYAALADVRYRIRMFLAFSEQAARAAGIAPQQHQLLLAIKAAAAEGTATIKHIAERLQLRHNSAVELVTRAALAKLIVRRPGERDRREVTLHLTPKGARVLERLSIAHRRAIGRSSADLIRALKTLDTSTRTPANVPR